MSVVNLYKNSRIQDQAWHCFHYPKKTYEQVIELKDVLVARQQSEKKFDVGSSIWISLGSEEGEMGLCL